MGRVIALVVLLVACGGSPQPTTPTISVSADRTGDTVTLDMHADLPDGAVLSWGVFDGPDGDVQSGHATVEGERAVAEADVSGFTADVVEVEVAFLPDFARQPETVDGYETATITTTAS